MRRVRHDSHAERNRLRGLASGEARHQAFGAALSRRFLPRKTSPLGLFQPRKLLAYEKCGLDRASSETEVWRVEVRAGKKELKDRWGIRTFDDVDRSIGDVVRYALDEVRYLAPLQTDSNVTRRKLDPLWLAIIEQSEGRLSTFSSGLLPTALKEVEQEIAIETYRGLVLGNIAGLAVAEGMDQETIETLLPERIRELVSAALNDPRGKLQKGIDRARERLFFVAP